MEVWSSCSSRSNLDPWAILHQSPFFHTDFLSNHKLPKLYIWVLPWLDRRYSPYWWNKKYLFFVYSDIFSTYTTQKSWQLVYLDTQSCVCSSFQWSLWRIWIHALEVFSERLCCLKLDRKMHLIFLLNISSLELLSHLSKFDLKDPQDPPIFDIRCCLLHFVSWVFRILQAP